VQGELAAPRSLQRCRNRHLHPELVGRVSLPLADAFHLMGMEAVDLAATLALLLLQNGGSLVERPAEDGRKFIIAGNLTGDVADGAPEIGLELRTDLLARLNCLAWA